MKCIAAVLIICLFTVSVSAQHIDISDQAELADSTLFKACHASTLVRFNNGNIRAAWFGGKFEGSPDVAIFTALRTGKTWGKPEKIATGYTTEHIPQACWNPVLFQARDGRLHLFYKVGPNPREWHGLRKYSDDEGKTWSDAIALPEGYLGPIKNKPLQLAHGNILYPSSTESLDEKKWLIHIEKSDNKLKRWKKIEIDCDTFQTIQPSILTYADGRLQLLARSKQNVIVQSWSADEGNTWSKVTATALPNPNSGSDAVTINGYQVLIYNPLPAGKNWWEGRSILKLAISSDGLKWKDIYTFEEHTKGEYSYPAIIADQQSNLYVSYTDNRKGIKFITFKLIP